MIPMATCATSGNKARAYIKLKKYDLTAKPKFKAFAYSLGLRPHNNDEMIACIKEGFPVSAFTKLRDELCLTEARLSDIVRIPTRTLARRKKEGVLTPAQSENVLRIAWLYEKACELLGQRILARKWLNSPKKALGGKTPLEYADTEVGAREVERLIGRLEYGVFS
jgi:putative toxin-antitoxin system antitoxin component (TIGR02293 family)